MSIPMPELKGWTDEDTGLTWSDKFDKQDMNSAEELADESGWRLPTVAEWKTLVKNDLTFKDSVPFKDTDIYWTGNPYIHNIEQKSLLAEFTRGQLDIAYTSRTNPQSVRLVK